MKNKEKYDIRHLIFNVSQYQDGTVKSIDIYYNFKRIKIIKFLSETSATQAMDAIGNWLEEEYVQDILTDKEKDYLSAFIKPFRKRIKYIKKIGHANGDQFLSITLENDYCGLPNFKKGTMYRGMELNKRYTLEELGL